VAIQKRYQLLSSGLLRFARNDGDSAFAKITAGGNCLAAFLLAASLAGCSGSAAPPPAGLNGAGIAEAGYVPSEEPYRLASEHYHRGEYGLSELYFRDAAEKAPRDASAWIGLAASYDRLRRFDLADRAYATAIKLSGETAAILNNQGYSYLLRGNVAGARAKFRKARALDPDNPTLLNNLKLLERSAKYAQHAAL
jgi:Tfp pilus assembly protein PilF